MGEENGGAVQARCGGRKGRWCTTAGVLALGEGEGEDGVGARGLGIHLCRIRLAKGRSSRQVTEITCR